MPGRGALPEPACPALAWCRPVLPPWPGLLSCQQGLPRTGLLCTHMGAGMGTRGQGAPSPSTAPSEGPGLRRHLQMLSVGRCCCSCRGDGEHPFGPDSRVEGPPGHPCAALLGVPSPSQGRWVMPPVPRGWGSSSLVQAVHTDQVGRCGAPAAAQLVNGSPHPPTPHLTTHLQNNSLPGAWHPEPPAQCQPGLHPTAQGPSCPPQGHLLATGQGGTVHGRPQCWA